jgi:5-(aminomethyl)-3-furanmethanol phosphate kinase
VSGCRVIKLGGSLLNWRGFPEALRTWCAQQTPMANVIVVGGGELVEAVRRLDRTHELPEATAHWLAIGALTVTARLAANLIAGSIVHHRLDELDLADEIGLQILDVLEFMQDDARSGDPLPETWDVTSDSIAARVAQRLEASELALLKSTLPDLANGACAIEELAASGYVDGYFPTCVPRGIRLRYVNLRSEEFGEQRIVKAERDPSLRSG